MIAKGNKSLGVVSAEATNWSRRSRLLLRRKPVLRVASHRLPVASLLVPGALSHFACYQPTPYYPLTMPEVPLSTHGSCLLPLIQSRINETNILKAYIRPPRHAGRRTSRTSPLRSFLYRHAEQIYSQATPVNKTLHPSRPDLCVGYTRDLILGRRCTQH